MLVTGTVGSGKTAFLNGIGEAVEPDDPAFIAFMEQSRVETLPENIRRVAGDDDSILYLMETRQRRFFDFIWEIAASGRMLGYVVMVDSAQSATFHETQSILQFFLAYGAQPAILVANFQDQPDAWDAETLYHLFQLDDDIPVIPCITSDTESVKTVLITLLEQVVKEIDRFDEQPTAL